MSLLTLLDGITNIYITGPIIFYYPNNRMHVNLFYTMIMDWFL